MKKIIHSIVLITLLVLFPWESYAISPVEFEARYDSFLKFSERKHCCFDVVYEVLYFHGVTYRAESKGDQEKELWNVTSSVAEKPSAYTIYLYIGDIIGPWTHIRVKTPVVCVEVTGRIHRIVWLNEHLAEKKRALVEAILAREGYGLGI